MCVIGIVGSRRRNSVEDQTLLQKTFQEILRYNKCIKLVSGGCPIGADHFAEALAKEHRIPITIHYPDKSKLKDNSPYWDYVKINHDRNTLIANDADILIAIVAPDRKGGTEDTIKKFLKRKSKKDLILL